MQKILVIQTAFIGDVVLATGLLEKLHQYYPMALLDILVRSGNENIFYDHPFIHEVMVWDKKENKYENLFRVLKNIRRNKYDAVINVQRYGATGFLTAFSKGKKRIGFDKNPFSFLFTNKIAHVFSGTDGKPMHEIERNHLLIEPLTDSVAAKPRLYPSDFDFEHVKTFQAEPYICIAPASVWFTKQFPKEKWIGFINQIPETYKIYIIGAPSDLDLCKRIKDECTHGNVANMAGKLTLLMSAALQAGAVMNYVNDSAPMHFASSMNAPVTAIYCSTIPGFGYGPLSDNSAIVEAEEALSCRPCGLHGKKACPKRHFDCANKIKNDQLLRQLTIGN